MSAYLKTVATATSAGSTDLGGNIIYSIENVDGTNFATISVKDAIGGDEEVALDAGEVIVYDRGIKIDTLYHQADTAAVNLRVVGETAQ